MGEGKSKPRRVEIDGVVYVPASEAQLAKLKPAGIKVSRSVAADLLMAFYLYDGDIRGRGARGLVFDALKAVAPGAAEMLSETDDAREVLLKCFPERLA